MYYLSQGLLKVYSSNSYGYDRVIAFLKDDNIFGLDCLDPDQPSVVTIECVTDSWVMPLQSEMLTGIMRESPDFACDLVAYYAKVMRQLCFDTENQSINDARVRLVNFLYLYAESSGDDRIAMSQQDLAGSGELLPLQHRPHLHPTEGGRTHPGPWPGVDGFRQGTTKGVLPIIVPIASYRYYKKREVIIENRFLLQYILPHRLLHCLSSLFFTTPYLNDFSSTNDHDHIEKL